jgi:hypothetical protein
MRIRGPAAGIALCASIASPLLAEDEDLVFAPSSAWTIDYDADSCALRRTFASGEDRAYLEIRRFAPGWGLQTTVASSRAGARLHPNVRYRFTDDQDWQSPGLGVSVTLESKLRGVIIEPSFTNLSEFDAIEDEAERDAYLRSIDFRAIERQRAAAIDSISLRGLGPRFTLRLGKLEAPIGALQDCIDELMAHWNIDVEAHKTLSRPAVPVNLREVPRMMDYPPKMIRQNMPGLVNVRLAIDGTGRITACYIQMPLSDPEFEESSCADIQHALDFDPALDKDGKPIASYWVTKVVFRLN